MGITRYIFSSHLGVLVLLAGLKLVLHTLTNGQYGFHRDELATVDDAGYLAWGYVAYPPLTPFVASVALGLFGPSLIGLRFFAALSQSIAMVLAGLLARELGGRGPSQLVAGVAVGIAPVSFAMSTMYQYVAFDFLWWVLVAYLTARLLNADDPRWWLGIGAAIGLGAMTKYTIGFLVVGLVVGVALTRTRRHLRSPWLWSGVAVAVLIVLPNLIWQIQHQFISLEFLQSIHARDVRIGRTNDFLLDQLRLAANPFTIPLWLAGLYFLFLSVPGRRYRLLGWMALIPYVLFVVAQGRGYYTAAIYSTLLAAGAVVWERWLEMLSPQRARLARGATLAALAVGGAIVVALGPYAPINSTWWDVASSVNTELKEEIGWPELTATVAGIYAALPEDERGRAGVLAGNYGEAGAINLYGPSYGLPAAISGVNSYWLRGYPDPPPQTLIVVGYDRARAGRIFESCELAGQVTNAYGVKNEETINHPDVFVCRGLRRPWPETWPLIRSFG